MTTSSPSARIHSRKSKYSKKTVQITVGPSREPFYVHVSHLEDRTSFFEVHGRPQGINPSPDSPGTTTSTASERDQTLSPAPVKTETGITDDTQTTDNTHNDEFAQMVYHLEGFVYESTAYEVIVNCLYNQLPDRPTTRHQCKTLLKSYVLALQYRITDLQDALVDCIRQYHREFTIAFEDLVWLINRLGHGEMIQKIPMVKYMIDQCAWEICSNGYKSFARQNPWFEPFLVLGDRPIRKVLFEAITEVSDHADPATGPNRYRVDDWVHFEQSAQNMTEFVELDD